MTEEFDGKIIYQAQSPDENALVSAARSFGFAFQNRTQSTINIQIKDQQQTFNLLNILDFTNERQRMSVSLLFTLSSFLTISFRRLSLKNKIKSICIAKVVIPKSKNV